MVMKLCLIAAAQLAAQDIPKGSVHVARGDGWYATLGNTGVNETRIFGGSSFAITARVGYTPEVDESGYNSSDWIVHVRGVQDEPLKAVYTSVRVGDAMGVMATYRATQGPGRSVSALVRPRSLENADPRDYCSPLQPEAQDDTDCPARCLVTLEHPEAAPFLVCALRYSDQACFDDKRCIPDEAKHDWPPSYQSAGRPASERLSELFV